MSKYNLNRTVQSDIPIVQTQSGHTKKCITNLRMYLHPGKF